MFSAESANNEKENTISELGGGNRQLFLQADLHGPHKKMQLCQCCGAINIRDI